MTAPKKISEVTTTAAVKSTSKAKAAAKPKAEPKTKVAATPKAEPKAKVAATPKAEPKAKAAAKPKAEPKAKVAATPKAEPKAKVAATPKAEPKAKAATKPKAEPKAKAATKPKAEPKAKAAAKPKAESKAKAAAKPKAEPKAKAIGTTVTELQVPTPKAKSRAKKPAISGRDLATVVAEAAAEHKPIDPVLLDLSGMSSIADWFFIASASSPRQMTAIAEKIIIRAKEHGVKPLGQEGFRKGGGASASNDHWVLVDLGEVVVHIFNLEARGMYDLEGLWTDAPRRAAKK